MVDVTDFPLIQYSICTSLLLEFLGVGGIQSTINTFYLSKLLMLLNITITILHTLRAFAV